MTKFNTLQELFEEWYQKQKAMDMNEKLGKYVAKRKISVESFCVDGAIDDIYWDGENDKRILYILREENGAHATDIDKDGNIIIGNGIKGKNFWVREQFKKFWNTKNTDAKLPVMLKKLVNVRLLIDANDTRKGLDENSTCANLMERTAFMNINKMGGDSSVHWPTLIAYAEKYSDYIKNEIEILSPDIIVCCGTYWLVKEKIMNEEEWKETEEKSVSYLTLENKSITVYDLPHTARRGIKVTEYGRQELIPEHQNISKMERVQEVEKIRIKIKEYIDDEENYNPEILSEIYDIIENENPEE